MGTYRGAVGVPGTHTAIRLVRLSQLTCGIPNNKMRGWEYDCYMNSTVHSRCMGISVYAGARATSGNTVLRPMHAQKKPPSRNMLDAQRLDTDIQNSVQRYHTHRNAYYISLWWSMLSSCMNRTASTVDTGAGRYIIFTALQLTGTYLSTCWGVVFLCARYFEKSIPSAT